MFLLYLWQAQLVRIQKLTGNSSELVKVGKHIEDMQIKFEESRPEVWDR